MKLVTALAALALLLTAGTGAVRAQSSFGSCTDDVVGAPVDVFRTNAQGLPHGLNVAQVVSIFAKDGMTIGWSPASSPVEINDYAMDYGGQGAQVDPLLTSVGLRNIVKQADGNPVSYTLTFAHPPSSFTFRRAPLHAGPSGVTNPPWNVTFNGDDHKFDGQSNVVIDDITWCP
jgi:hypothetical protein